MKINWKITPGTDRTVSVCLFSDLRKLAASITECGKVVFGVSRRTKTSLSIEVSSGERSCPDVFAVCHIPDAARDLKFVTTNEYSFFDGKSHRRDHFRLSKRQGLPELKRYLSAVLDEMLPHLDGVEAEIVINGIPELSAGDVRVDGIA